MSDEANSELFRNVAAAANAERKRRQNVKTTRELILAFGEQIVALLIDVDREAMNTLGLSIRLVARGVPVVSSETLRVEDVPALDGPGFDARPGTTSLYLEALGIGQDRQYMELRANAGLMVLVDSSLESVEKATALINGIGYDQKGDLLLWRRADRDDSIHPTLSAEGFLKLFVQHLSWHLERAAKFNPALR